MCFPHMSAKKEVKVIFKIKIFFIKKLQGEVSEKSDTQI